MSNGKKISTDNGIVVLSDGSEFGKYKGEKDALLQYLYQFLPLLLMVFIQIIAGENYRPMDYIETAILVVIVDLCVALGSKRQVYGRTYHPVLLLISGLVYFCIETGITSESICRDRVLALSGCLLVVWHVYLKIKSSEAE